MEADLAWLALPRDTMLDETGALLEYVHFPTRAIVSLVSSLATAR